MNAKYRNQSQVQVLTNGDCSLITSLQLLAVVQGVFRIRVYLSDSDWLVLFGAPECIAAFSLNKSTASTA